MRTNESSVSLTHFVVDGLQEIDPAELQDVMKRVQRAVLYAVPRSRQAHVATALLNLAVSHMLHETNVHRTVEVLIRAADSILEHETVAPQMSVDLTATH